MAGRWIASELERTVYAIAGLPIAIRGESAAPSPQAAVIRRAFAQRYWHPGSPLEAVELGLGILAAPLAVPLAALWFTLRNGRMIHRREGKTPSAQFIEQLRLYLAAGIVGPWYYILSLHRDGQRRAPTFLQRCETKRGVYALLKDANASPIGDKQAFAEACASAGLRCVKCELLVDDQLLDPDALPDADLFVKPVTGCGGKGAERWDKTGPRTWTNGRSSLCASQLLRHLKSRGERLVVQRLVRAHPALANLTAGALPTVRALTILDERGRPELVGAVFRMSIGSNRTVDNIHAGGLACAISLPDGRLGIASDLGSDAGLGWHERHPTTGGRITGFELPYWEEVKSLAARAHLAFRDRTIIGWDIAIDCDGPLIVEGNRGPDVDLMQRFMDVGFCEHHRFGELMAYHLNARGYGLARPVSVRGEVQSRAMHAAGADRAGP